MSKACLWRRSCSRPMFSMSASLCSPNRTEEAADFTTASGQAILIKSFASPWNGSARVIICLHRLMPLAYCLWTPARPAMGMIDRELKLCHLGKAWLVMKHSYSDLAFPDLPGCICWLQLWKLSMGKWCFKGANYSTYVFHLENFNWQR